MSVMRKALVISLITAASILLLTCGEAEIQPPLTPGPGTGPSASGLITDEQRLAVLKECKDFVNALGDLKSEAVQQVIVSWLKTRPEFEDAGIAEGNVWGTFRDDRIAMIVPNWRGVGGEDGGRLDLSNHISKKNKYRGGRTSGQPGGNQVKLFFGFGKGFRDYRPSIDALFQKSDTDYDVNLEEASIENLKNARDLGVFFLDTHGGMGRRKPKEDEPPFLFGLWTTDTISVANERTFEADLNSHFLTYMLALHNAPGVNEWHYAITEYFVRYPRYMSFEENAVLYFDGCNGMTPAANSLMNAMIKKAKNEMATFIGWTGLTDNGAGEPTASFIFDRMLGTNTDVASIGAESPVQRPFDFSKIWEDMANFNVGNFKLGVSSYGGAIAYHSVNTSEIILTPSIEYITVDENESKMYIKGLFGDYNTSDLIVTVGGLAVPAKYFDMNLLQCDLPTVGPGSIGDVVVSIRGNKSNVVPLTEWIIPLHLVKEDAGINLDARLNLRIRADVHPYRSKPGEAPKKDRPDSLGLLLDPLNPGWPFAIGTNGNYSLGGQRQATCILGKCEALQTESASSRSGVLPYLLTTSGLRFGAYYKWSVDMKTLYVSLHVVVPDVGFEFRSSIKCPGQPDANNDQSANGEVIVQIPLIDLPVLKFHFDDYYYIQPDGVERSQDVQWGRFCKNNDKLKVTAQWPEVSPAFPPTRNTEARVEGN